MESQGVHTDGCLTIHDCYKAATLNFDSYNGDKKRQIKAARKLDQLIADLQQFAIALNLGQERELKYLQWEKAKNKARRIAVSKKFNAEAKARLVTVPIAGPAKRVKIKTVKPKPTRRKKNAERVANKATAIILHHLLGGRTGGKRKAKKNKL